MSSRYEQVPTSEDDGGNNSNNNSNRRSSSRAEKSIVLAFGHYAFLATIGFVALCLFCSIFPLSLSQQNADGRRRGHTGLPLLRQRDLTMDESTCVTEFPAFYQQLEDNVKAWKAKGGVTKLDVDHAAQGSLGAWGYARIVIRDGNLYVREFREGVESRMSALLHLINQAITTDPGAHHRNGPLPPIDMVLSTADRDGNSSPAAWVIAKPTSEDPSLGRWLLPDFGFAGWPEAGIASFAEFQQRADKEERSWPWDKKAKLAFWRGLANNYAIRTDLLDRTRPEGDPERRKWFDVKQTSFHDVGAEWAPIVPMHEHCRQKFLIQSEGNSYSGRFKYLLSCHSVTIAHPLQWTQHFHPALNSDSKSPKQNFVELKGPLFEGLEEEIKALREIDDRGVGRDMKASTNSRNSPLRIADNAQETLRDRYLTPAATMCYTRAALRAYASVQNTTTWPVDPFTEVNGPAPQGGPGGGVVPSAAKGKDLAAMGVKGDVEYGVWRLLGSVNWPPAPFAQT